VVNDLPPKYSALQLLAGMVPVGLGWKDNTVLAPCEYTVVYCSPMGTIPLIERAPSTVAVAETFNIPWVTPTRRPK
jgi:hypothetical protein